MSTVLRPEVSDRNEYYISKHRYYELQHFCLQYPEWEKSRNFILGLKSRSQSLGIFSKGRYSDPTEKNAEELVKYSRWMDLVNDAASNTDPYLGKYIFKAVTEQYTYDQIKARFNICCSKADFYQMRRRFFWILSHSRE